MMALPMNSLYSLTWGDYGTSLVSAIQLLRCHGDLVDCTLAAGGRSFPAHKIVLCAASPFLLDLLKNTPCKHPVVMLAGVNANDLEALLEFVYRGEVSVDHAQLPSLLQAAQCLNIQGLAPQTVTKDDYTTHSIQLQHMIPHHHEQDQLIATIATAPQQTVHAQVVDDIHQTGQILQATTTQNNPALGQQQQQQQQQQQTIITTDNPKDVIQQYLPARKRKPRVKKLSTTASAPKIAKVEGIETIISTSATSHAQNTQGTMQATSPQLQQQQGQQQQQNIENGIENPLLTSTPIIKSEVTKVETIVMDPNTSGDVTTMTATTTPAKTGKRSKSTQGTDSKSKTKPRSRSQSEQPATCPICYAVIRQSRNLRRHLELRHFAKPGVKKEKKSKSDNSSDNTNNKSNKISSTTDNSNITNLNSTVATEANITGHLNNGVLNSATISTISNTPTVAPTVVMGNSTSTAGSVNVGVGVDVGVGLGVGVNIVDGTLTHIPIMKQEQNESGIGENGVIGSVAGGTCIVDNIQTHSATNDGDTQMHNVIHLVSQDMFNQHHQQQQQQQHPQQGQQQINQQQQQQQLVQTITHHNQQQLQQP